MSLDKIIEIKKVVLYHAMESKGVMHKDTIKISEELDKLIVKKMVLGYIKS